MEKIFWVNPYQHTLSTRIQSVKGNEVLCAQTIAYSFSGGQESDRAYINDMEIISSRMEGSLIFYTLPDDHKLQENQEVIMKIDWQRRLKLMRLHFAAELVLEIVTRKSQFEKVGAHIAETKARIDFKSEVNISFLFPEILEEYEAIIQANKKIETDFSDLPTQRRFWKIDGFAQVPCGGTHLRSTGEVGYITLKRAHPGKALERIEIYLKE